MPANDRSYIRMGVAYMHTPDGAAYTAVDVRNILIFCCLADEERTEPGLLHGLLGEYLVRIRTGCTYAPFDGVRDPWAVVDFVGWLQRELADPKDS